VEKNVLDLFRASTEIIIGDGAKTLFWIDNWLDGLTIETLAPNLFKAVPPRFRSRTVRDGLLNGTWISDIKGPLSEGMVVEYVEVWEKVRQVALTAGVEDKFRWR